MLAFLLLLLLAHVSPADAHEHTRSYTQHHQQQPKPAFASLAFFQSSSTCRPRAPKTTTCPSLRTTTSTARSMAAAPSSAGNEKRVERTYTKLLPPHVTSAAEAYDAWLQYAWIEGADLPLAKAPIILERGDPQSGNGLLRRIPPIGIEEKIVDAAYPARVEYKVNYSIDCLEG